MQERNRNLEGLILFALLKTHLWLVIQRLLVIRWIGFSTIGHKLASDMPDAEGTYCDYLDPPLNEYVLF